MRLLQVSRRPVRCLCYSPDGGLLATGDEEHCLGLWSLPACEPVEIFEASHSIETLAFHPTESLVAAGLGSGEILLWQPNSKKPQAATSAHPRGVRALTWRPDGATLVSAGWDSTVQFFHTSTLATRRAPLTTPVPVTGLAYRPDGRLLALADSFGTVYALSEEVWPGQTARGQHGLFALAMTPAGDLLAIGDARGQIDLWHLPSLTPAGALLGHEWTIYGLAFTPSGRSLLSGGADGTVPPLENSCPATGGNLSLAQSLGDVPGRRS